MTPELGPAVELLERSLGYTRVALAVVAGADPGGPTPCARWSLGMLLGHMEDSLDAFLEAARGEVAVGPVPPVLGRVPALQEKACALLGAWSRALEDPGTGPTAARVRVGTAPALPATALVLTAALEVTVHGWDVGRATDGGDDLPEPLAAELLAPSRLLVTRADRGRRFAPPVDVGAGSSAAEELLGFLGRDPRWRASHDGADLTGPPGQIRPKTPTRGDRAS